MSENIFSSIVRRVEPEIDSLRQALAETLPCPETVTRTRPSFVQEIETYYARESVGMSPVFPEQYEELPGEHYADSWTRYIHPDCRRLKQHEKYPHSLRLTQEIMDIAQIIITKTYHPESGSSSLLEELIHEQETNVPIGTTTELDELIDLVRQFVEDNCKLLHDSSPDRVATAFDRGLDYMVSLIET